MESISTELEDRIEYKNEYGRFHREGGPAIIWTDGSEKWFFDGKLHRDGGPAITLKPAILLSPSYKRWAKHGLTHREDGPAIEASDGSREWWYNGKEISCSSDAGFKKFLKLKAFV